MKCASATAGIASIVTGLAMVLSGASAHATFLYLHQSQLIGAAVSASGVASAAGESPVLDTHYDARYADVLPITEGKANGYEADLPNVAVLYAGLQQSSGVYGDDANSRLTSYFAPTSFRWTNSLSATRADGVVRQYRNSTVIRLPSAGSTAAVAPAKDSRGVAGGTPPPSVPDATVPGATVPSATAPSSSVPSASLPSGISPPAHSLPAQSTPINTPPTVEAPIVGLPSRSVPEPSSVGLLGIGLLMVFIAVARGKRARYYFS